MAAVTSDLSEVLFADLVTDAVTRGVSGYSLSGLRAGVSYRVLLIGSQGEVTSPQEASLVVVWSSMETRSMDLVFRVGPPRVMARSRRSGS